MLKRHQILLEDWQIDYIKKTAKEFDLSISEVVRMHIVQTMLTTYHTLGRKEAQVINRETLAKMIKQFNSEQSLEEKHKLLSKLYFEARKVSELSLTK